MTIAEQLYSLWDSVLDTGQFKTIEPPHAGEWFDARWHVLEDDVQNFNNEWQPIHRLHDQWNREGVLIGMHSIDGVSQHDELRLFVVSTSTLVEQVFQDLDSALMAARLLQ